MRKFFVSGFFVCVILAVTCKKPTGGSTGALFTKAGAVAIKRGFIDEVSGIADSKANEGYLWAQQDGGNPPELHLLKHDGAYVKSIKLNGIANRDWEEMAVGSGPDKTLSYIYLADIGDNNQQYQEYYIYRFPEPSKEVDAVNGISKITFRYPDGAHDAEAMFLDQATADIYIVTKRDTSSIIYKLPFPHSITTINTAIKINTLPFSGAVAAATSPDEKEMLIKTYTHIYYWKRATGQQPQDALQNSPQDLEYEVEPQGEALCFKKDGSGFFTISEKNLASFVYLHFYKRQ